jgi:plastocyanin
MLLGCVGTAPGAAGEVVHVTIGDLAFSAAEMTARVGDTVEWVNGDFIDHTATAVGGNWDVLVNYFCRFHPSMAARIHVLAD